MYGNVGLAMSRYTYTSPKIMILVKFENWKIRFNVVSSDNSKFFTYFMGLIIVRTRLRNEQKNVKNNRICNQKWFYINVLAKPT